MNFGKVSYDYLFQNIYPKIQVHENGWILISRASIMMMLELDSLV